MRRWIALGSFSIVLFTAIPASAAPLERVLDEADAREMRPSWSDGDLVWSQTRIDSSRPHSFLLPDGGDRVRLNPIGTSSSTAVIDGTTVVFQRSRRGDGDLRFYDVTTGVRSALPEGINTDADESAPALSGDWLLFRRMNTNKVPFRDAFARLILVNLDTLERRRLVDARATRRFVLPDQVNGDWLTYETCALRNVQFSNCQVWLYQISTDTRARLPNPGLQQYAGGVTSDGTVYLVRSGDEEAWRCGVNARIVRVPLGEDGEGIAGLRDGRDALATFAVEEGDGSVTLYVERDDCEDFDETGIYRILNADTA